MLVLPEAIVIGHCDTKVLLDSDRRCLALETMLRSVFCLARLAAIVDVETSVALGACRSLAYHALANKLLPFAQATLNVLDCGGRRRARPSTIEIALELELPGIVQEPHCQLEPRWGSRKAWWHHHPDLLCNTIHGDCRRRLGEPPRMHFPCRPMSVARLGAVCLRHGC